MKQHERHPRATSININSTIKIGALVCIAVALAACSAATMTNNSQVDPTPSAAPATYHPTPTSTVTTQVTAAPAPTVTLAPASASSRIDRLLNDMSLEQKAGQVLAIGFDGKRLTPALRNLIRDLHIGGIFIFDDNVQSPEQVARLVRDIQDVSRANGDPPLIVAIDQEGGAVARLHQSQGFTEFPSPMSIMATGDVNNARIVGQAMASELKALGVNMNLAPVLDVNTNPANPIISIRSFGSNSEKVAEYGKALIEALQTEGVMAVGKHFPGHGRTSVDSHEALPIVENSRAQLDAVDLVPFRAAIDSGVAAVMSAHVNYPALEGDALESGALEGAAPESTPKLPATLSPKVLTGLLRDELKFDGLLMTDSLEMGALGANGYAPDEAAARALAAGADLLAFNTDLKVYRKAHARIVQGVRDGEIPMARLDDAVRRVLRAKERYGILDASADSSNSSSWVGSSETRQRIAHVIAKTITLSRDDARLLPLLADTPLLVIETPYAYGLSGSLDRPGARVNERPTPGQINSMIVRAKGRIALVATSDIARNPTQADLVRALIGAGVPTIVWAVKSPYDLLYLRDTLPLTFIATYGTPPYLLIQPMLDVLYGRANATGRLPVDLP